jgi:hypothetical protein
LLTTLSATAHADSIVADGNFEAAAPGEPADSTAFYNLGSSIDGGSWFVTQGTVGVDTQDYYVFDGNKSVFLNGDVIGPDSLTQTLNTTIGQTYTIGFWANSEVPNAFSVTFGGVPVTGAPSSIADNGFPSPNWLGNSSEFTFFTGTALATSTTSALTFTATGFPGPLTGTTVEIDDVTVTPEPGSIVLMLTGIAVLGLAVGKNSLANVL